MTPEQDVLLARLANIFDPFRPLPAGDPTYVDLKAVRGDGDVLRELGRTIIHASHKSNHFTCQLYSGHRGGGKSTELLKLQKYLEEKGFQVVYFAADEDIDVLHVEYTDILFACTKHLIEKLRQTADPMPIIRLFRDLIRYFSEFDNDLSFDEGNVEAGVAEFVKFSAKVKASPTVRQKIRERLDPHTPTLIDALNEFIQSYAQRIQKPDKVVVIADNLDRIVPTVKDGRLNHEQIFLDRSEQLRALKCHIVYTVPISMVFSHEDHLQESFGKVRRLPMIMVRTRQDSDYVPGIDRLREFLNLRIKAVFESFSVDNVFDNPNTWRELCLRSGGHVRGLIYLIRIAIQQIDQLPITEKAARRAISEFRDTYQKTVRAADWEKLAKTSISKNIENDADYRRLLFNRSILEYCDVSTTGEIEYWYNVNPVILGIGMFQTTLHTIQQQIQSP
ncbi:MAG TPA: AAA family ATPase [Acidobacteriota bacterium]|nr:AAA family ATPase [Acidobacteriota bacterium]HNG93690.1 AAA family ATPase [Acidobacteriota bacterium]